MAASPGAALAVSFRGPEEIEALRRALEALSRVLSGPAVARYRFASASKPGVEYVITAGEWTSIALARASNIAGSAVMRATSRRCSPLGVRCRRVSERGWPKD